jgi:uncharacterized repeat protein (TIGR02543 family)
MKRKRKILSLLLAICLVAGLMPTTVFALDGDKAIMLGARGISGYDAAKGSTGYDYIYFGNWTAQDEYTTSGPIKWRVLDDKTNTNADGLFLLSDVSFGTGSSGNMKFNNVSKDSNAWQGSDAQAWCNTFASSNLNSRELAAILETTKSDEAFENKDPYPVEFAASENILNRDKVFFLSAEEAKNSAYGFVDDDARIADYGDDVGAWWLRSPRIAEIGPLAGVVNYEGNVASAPVFYDENVRPAFNLNLDSVLFTSAAVGGKAAKGMDSGLTAVDDYTGSEWKLTLLDSSRSFSISDAAINNSGDAIAFSYSGAQTGANEYISVVIEDNGAITHYGRILQLDGMTHGESGTANLTLPAGVTLRDATKLYVCNEQYNGGTNDDTKLTDYSSKLIEVKPAVDKTAPTLTAGDVSRTSETTAAVKFTSSEAGSYYYAVAESGTEEPTVDTTGAGTSCANGENTISLTTLSGAGAKDIYIVAKDNAGNISQQLKITIPAYAASDYSISVSPTTLNFGSKTAGYTEAPVAQTVTIQNTGSQNVTVNLPAGKNYTVTAGKDFANGTATLVPSGTATFTVRPKSGLDVGSYPETLTISGSNSTSAGVDLAFTVTDVTTGTYTLTVNLNGGSGSTVGGEYPAGEVIKIDAGSRSNYRFNGWTSSNGGTFADASSASTTFTMPAADTTITADWSYAGGGGGGGAIDAYYTITASAGKGGSISPSGSVSVLKDMDSTFTMTPDSGYRISDVLVDGKSIGAVTSYTFESVQKDHTIEAVFAKDNPFTDVYPKNWFFEAVMFVYENNLMNGTGTTTFSPTHTTTRAQIATIFYRMAGSPAVKDTNSFIDVPYGPSTDWYYDAVLWVRQNGIMQGYGDNRFGPNNPVTREQLAMIFYNYGKFKGYDTTASGDLSGFTDAGDLSPWAQQAMQWAVGSGVMNGKGNGILDPKDTATRAEIAVMLQNFMEKNNLESPVI